MKARKLFMAVLFTLAIAAPVFSAPPPIPNLSTWETNMKNCSAFITAQPAAFVHTCNLSVAPYDVGCAFMNYPNYNGTGGTPEQFLWYYDGNRVMRQIARYTGDNSYMTAAVKCREFYKAYLDCPRLNSWIPRMVDGWRNFSKGFYYDWIYDNDATSKQYIIDIATDGHQAQAQHPGDVPGYLANPAIVDGSREIAYAINDYHYCHEMNVPGFFTRDPYIDVALYQLDTWTTYLQGYPGSTYPGEPSAKYQPFMFALTCEALINVYTQTNTTQADKDKILAKISAVARLTYDKLYDKSQQAFMSNTGNPTVYWPSINPLICPLYGWLWHETGDSYWLEAGDRAFSDGVTLGWTQVWGGKQFSQQYRWSFDYVAWRSVDPVTVPPPVTGGSGDPFPNLMNYPNPFKSGASATAKISGLTGNCTVDIYNNNGLKVRSLSEYPNFGFVAWDGKNDAGDTVAAGIYVYIAKDTTGTTKKGKLALVK